MRNKKEKKRSVYFIGIKGVGMTMLAQFLKSQGYEVSGSDISDSFLTDGVLSRHKIPVFSPFNPKNIPIQTDLIIYSSAFNQENNLELLFVKQQKERFSQIPVLSYAEALGEQFNQYKGLAVCGSHGKTTTTAWLGYVLKQAGLSPNVLVGSNVPQFKGSGLVGKSSYLLAEVDEYQNKMRFFNPYGVILNNVDYDHPDYFPTQTSYRAVFKKFIQRVPSAGWLVVNFDDVTAKSLSQFCPGKVIGYSIKLDKNKVEYRASELNLSSPHPSFRLFYRGRDQGRFKISLAGEHNVLNALAVIASSRQLGLSWSSISRYLATFKGTERRCQILGEYQGATIIDDYAHHPSEIKATLAALRQRFPHKRLITVFHPHTFSRTKAFFSDFVSSFSQSDQLIILDVYSSARESLADSNGATSRDLATAISNYNHQEGIKQEVRAIKTMDLAAKVLRRRLHANDCLILMGAGDVFRLAGKLLGK